MKKTILLGAMLCVLQLPGMVAIAAAAPATPKATPKATQLQQLQPININQADLAQLMQIKGIGKQLAARIIAYRKANGPFQSIQDLSKVHGVGTRLLAREGHKLSI